MERYLGLDVHAASSTRVMLSEAGRRLKRCVLETDGQSLVEAIRTIPGRQHLCFRPNAVHVTLRGSEPYGWSRGLSSVPAGLPPAA